MNRIINIDPVLGYADIQPGVTQGQLSTYLIDNNLPFFMDVTGAGRDSSVLGNCVEGGFGTSPNGNKRKEITNIHCVLGNGELFETGHFPGSLGPDLSGMFVQSNFGIITQLRIQLNTIPDAYQAFIINVKNNSGIVPLINSVRELRQKGSIINQVTIINAVDALYATSLAVPESYKGRLLSNDDAKKILSNPFFKFGSIFVLGAVYGSAAEVRAKKRTIKKAIKSNLKGEGSILFIKAKLIQFMIPIFKSWPLNKTPFGRVILKNLDLFMIGHGLMRGMPTDYPLTNLFGGVEETYANKRVMWYSSRISTKPDDVKRFIKIAESSYEEQQFEYPFEMLVVSANDIIAIQKIEWNKASSDEERRAHALYSTMSERLMAAGFYPYRLGIQSQLETPYPEGRLAVLEGLKKSLDPNCVISPGRYGIK
jgi:4-cresol dehydrogenase (hydroxylating)